MKEYIIKDINSGGFLKTCYNDSIGMCGNIDDSMKFNTVEEVKGTISYATRKGHDTERKFVIIVRETIISVFVDNE